MQKTNNTTHWVLGGALLLIGLFVIIALILVRSQAEETPQASVSVDNLGPTFSSFKICSGSATSGELSSCSDISGGITLSAGATDSNTVVFTVTDDNGTSDLPTNADASSIFSNACGEPPCTPDNNNAYYLTCTKSIGVSTTESYYTCPLNLAYYAYESSAWDVDISLSDTAGSSTSTSESATVNALTAGTFGNIPFGTKSLGFNQNGTEGDAVVVDHYNNGNTTLDFYVRANSDLGCDVLGTIPAANVVFDDSSETWSGSFWTLSSSATVGFSNLNAQMRTNDNSTSAHLDNSYWQIKIPNSGIAGSCSATITAVAAANLSEPG